MMTVQESPAAPVAPAYPLVVVPGQSTANIQASGSEESAAASNAGNASNAAALTSELLERVAASSHTEHSTFKFATIGTLFRSPMNVRNEDSDVSDLLPLIGSQGLLQNLIGYEEVIDGQATGRIAIVAGGRRLKCLGILTGETQCSDECVMPFFGTFPIDYAIPFLLVSESEAVAHSLAENSGRKGMHPADIAAAMLALFKAGAAVEDISVSFGIEAKTVRQYLKLANLAPALFTMYRKDELKFEQVRALAITDDHNKQVSVIQTLGARAQEWNIRQLLAEHHLTASAPLVKYVTVTAYQEAGGAIEKDLFSQSETVLLTDIPLLHKLASEKLAKKQARVQKDGHAWVEARVEFTEADKSDFAAIRTVSRQLSEEEATELTQIATALEDLTQKLVAAHEALDTNSEGDESDEGDGETVESSEIKQLSESINDLEAREAEIKKSLRGIHEGDKALAGAIVTIDYNGQATVVTGLIRSQDQSKMEKLTKDKSDDAAPVKADHSDRLTNVLTSHRTIALQAELMQRPDVALVLATYSLVRNVLLDRSARWASTDACKITQTSPRLADEVDGSKANLAIAEKRSSLVALLPEDASDDKLFAWLLAQPQTTVLDLLAFCTAVSCDLTLTRESSTDKSFKPLADAVQLDMRNWWTATSETYFKHVSKQRMMTVVQQAVSLEKSVPLEKMKKGEAAEAATLAVADTGWLPEMLRVA